MIPRAVVRAMSTPLPHCVKHEDVREDALLKLPEQQVKAMRLAMFTPEDVTAIVVTHHSAEVVGPCLAALAREGVAALVVDNASHDDSVAIAQRQGARVIPSLLNEGYGRANNIGAQAAATRFLLICNPDVTVEFGSIKRLLAAAQAFPDAGIWAPLVVEPDGRRFVQPRSLLSPPHLNQAQTAPVLEGVASIPFVSGACFLIERERFLRFGGFDPEIFLYFEDDDLCRRLMDAGHAPLIEPAAIVTHLRGGSTPPTPARRYRSRWHMAWSERHVRRKHGLPKAPVWPVAWNAIRAGLNALILWRMDAARYAGSVAGAIAHARGVRATVSEGLFSGDGAGPSDDSSDRKVG